MVTFLKQELEYGTFYIGETTEGTVILPYDIFETKKQALRQPAMAGAVRLVWPIVRLDKLGRSIRLRSGSDGMPGRSV